MVAALIPPMPEPIIIASYSLLISMRAKTFRSEATFPISRFYLKIKASVSHPSYLSTLTFQNLFMTEYSDLLERAEGSCELCNSEQNLTIFEVKPSDECILVCEVCKAQLSDPEAIEENHWRCLNDSMWSQVPAVQVVVWRMLNQIKEFGWPVELLDMLYMDDETLTWAKSSSLTGNEHEVQHIDANGAPLESGDTVVLIKDLNVKGAGFTAKRGTAVRRISLVHDNAEHIEGRVDGQQIVILTKYVKKSS